MPFSRYSTYNDGNFACFVTLFVFKKRVKTGINKLSGSPQWHITFDLKQVALKFQKPLAGENLSIISNVFQNNYYKIIVAMET